MVHFPKTNLVFVGEISVPSYYTTQIKMSAFRTNNPRNNQRREEEAYWRAQDALRAREAEQKRVAAQNQEKTVAQRDEKVFPTLGGARSAVARREGGPGPRPMGFAAKARDWKNADDEAAAAAARAKMLETEALRAERLHNSVDGIFIWRPQHVQEERVEEERPFRENTDGWTEVSHKKVQKSRAAMTAEEVDAMYAEGGEEMDEFNGEYYENNKHDHR